ncbi:MAG: efflux RND transporter permease subunit [Alphaproteobacteria bacterium]|nr:efflux RND transporter permease subunit [Alphaproteobacteria bacterium]
MSLPEIAIEKRNVTYFFGILLLVGGIGSFFSLGWLEDPEFTVKTAAIVTAYPGASAEEVELEVTDRLEIALQELTQLDELYSISRAGLSIIRVDIKSEYFADRLPQVWDEMRSKIEDATPSLPPGAAPPEISDDWGFVYGFLFALTSAGYTPAELEEYAKHIKKELSVVQGVARVELWGVQDRVVYVDVSQQQLSQLGLTPTDLSLILEQQNMVLDAGSIDSPVQRFRVTPTGTFASPEEIGELTFTATLASAAAGVLQRGQTAQTGRPATTQSQPSRFEQLIQLKDIATVTQGYQEPPSTLMWHNGKPAIGISMAGVDGANIVEVGKRIDKRLNELMLDLPVGVEVDKISWQSDIVDAAIVDFMINLAMAVVIVLVVLTLPMGWRMGVIIGSGLILTILGTLVFLAVFGIDLHRMSLGALVIALGMMVDNCIVVADGFVVRLQQGMDRKQAAIESARTPSFSLLGATIIAVMAFYPIFSSPEDAGEYCKDLFTVVGISLIFSWVVSMTFTPLQCIDLLPSPKPGEETEAYSGALYRGFRKVVTGAIRARFPVVGVLVGLLVVAMVGFQGLPQQFFPDSARPQFLVDYWAPEGTRIQTVSEDLKAIEAKMLEDERIESVSIFIGQGPPRFYLPVESEFPYETYANIVVNTRSSDDVGPVVETLEPWMKDSVPEALTRVRLYGLGPSDTWKFEARFSGPQQADPAILRDLADQGKAILEASPLAKEINTDMRNRVRRLEIEYNEARARWANISRVAIAESTKRAFDGQQVGLYREGDTLIPIKLRLVEQERGNIGELDVLQISSSMSSDTIPLSQVTDTIGMRWEDPIIIRYQRRRANTVQASPKGVTFPTLYDSVVEEFEKIELPPGYELFWDGELKSTADAQAALIPGVIPAAVIVLFIIVYLYNAFRPPLIILLTIPFVFIGISPALLATQVPFGFVALLGAMSLSGMMIKNAIVLLDEIEIGLENGLSRYDAVVNAAVARLRPVVLAAATTVLGVIPLLQDVFWVGMAITIMAGLTAGTIMVLVLVPVLYCIFYRVKPGQSAPEGAGETAPASAPAE